MIDWEDFKAWLAAFINALKAFIVTITEHTPEEIIGAPVENTDPKNCFVDGCTDPNHVH